MAKAKKKETERKRIRPTKVSDKNKWEAFKKSEEPDRVRNFDENEWTW
jgi:hypothetical protein